MANTEVVIEARNETASVIDNISDSIRDISKTLSRDLPKDVEIDFSLVDNASRSILEIQSLINQISNTSRSINALDGSVDIKDFASEKLREISDLARLASESISEIRNSGGVDLKADSSSLESAVKQVDELSSKSKDVSLLSSELKKLDKVDPNIKVDTSDIRKGADDARALANELSTVGNVMSSISSGSFSFIEDLGAVVDVGGIAGGIVNALKDIALAVPNFVNEVTEADERIAMMFAAGSVEAEKLGLSYQELVDRTMELTDGAVSTSDAMRILNQSMKLQVIKTMEDLDKAVLTAAASSQLMGRSFEESMGTIAIGVGRLSPQILDELGTIVNVERELDKFAFSIGKTADELTDMEKRSASLDVIFNDFADSINQGIGSQANSVDQFATSIDSLRGNIGRLIGEFAMGGRTGDSFFAGLINSAAESVESLRQTKTDNAIDSALSAVESLVPAIEELRGASQSSELSLIGQATAAVQLAANISALNVFYNDLILFSRNTGEMTDEMRDSMLAAEKALGITSSATVKFSGNIRKAAMEIKANNRELRIFGELLGTPINDMEKLRQVASLSGVSFEELLEQMRKVRSIDLKSESLEQSLSIQLSTAIDEDGAQKALDEAVQFFRDGLKEINGLGLNFGQETVEIEKVTKGAQAIVDEFIKLDRLQSSLADNASRFSNNLARSAANIVPALGIERAGLVLQQVTRDYERQRKVIESVADTEQERVFLLTELQNRSRSVFTDMDRLFNSTGPSNVGASQTDRMLDNIKSSVDGALSGAFDVSIDLDQILGRQDEVDEPARRLADIAIKGWDSPWVDYFRKEFPDIFDSFNFNDGSQIKEQAARHLRAYEKGLRPELIDKNIAKNLARAAIVGESNTRKLVNEISADLQKEFKNLPSGDILAVVSDTLASSNPKPQISAYAQSILAVTEQENLGGKMNQLISGQLGGNLQSLIDAGVLVGTSFNSGVMQGAGQMAEFQQIPTLGPINMKNVFSQVDFTEQVEAFSEGMTTQINTINVGMRVANQVSSQIKSASSLEQIEGAGLSSGEAYSTGFLSGIDELPDRGRRKIAQIVAPDVADIIRRDEERAG